MSDILPLTNIEIGLLAINLLVLWQLGVGSFVRFVCFQIGVALCLELYDQVGRIDDDWEVVDLGQPGLLLAGAMISLYLAFRSSSRKS